MLTREMQLKKFSFKNLVIFYLWADFNGMNMRRTDVGVCVNKILKNVGKRYVFVYMRDPFFLLKKRKKLKVGITIP